MLTRKQLKTLDFLAAYQAEHRVYPTMREVAAGIGLTNPSGVHRLIGVLEERGYIRRLPNRARAIEILKMPGEKA